MTRADPEVERHLTLRAGLGMALGSRALECERAIAASSAAARLDSAASDAFLERRDDTVLMGVLLVARWLVTGLQADDDEFEWLSALGELAADEGLDISERTRGYLIWRDCLTRVVQEEAARLLVPAAVIEEALAAVRASCDASLVRMGKAFDRKSDQLRDQLVHQSLHDPLTQLPNRRLFNDRLTQGLLSSHRTGRRLALLLLDLDGFKQVNDKLGHQAGDEWLVEVAARLRAAVRRSDTVARWGGDEFALLLEGVAGAEEASAVASKLLEVLRVSFLVGGRKRSCGASVGIAFYPDHAGDAASLIKQADTAMYAAKRSGAGFAFPESGGRHQSP